MKLTKSNVGKLFSNRSYTISNKIVRDQIKQIAA